MVQDLDGLADRVLDCANRVAGTQLRLSDHDDLALDAFGFDSLSLFAFMLELEESCGLAFDESLLEPGRLDSIRSLAALIARQQT